MLDKLELFLSILDWLALLDIFSKMDKDGTLDRLLSQKDGNRTIIHTGWKNVFFILCFLLPPAISALIPSPINFVILTAIIAVYIGYLIGRRKNDE